MKLTLRIFGVLLVLCFVGCATVHSKANKVSSGMSQQQVLNIMGPPTSKNISSDGEVWYYFQARAFEYQTVFITFENGKVVSLRTGY